MKINSLLVNFNQVLYSKSARSPIRTSSGYTDQFCKSRNMGVGENVDFSYLNQNCNSVAFHGKNSKEIFVMLDGKKVKLKVKFTEEQINKRIKALAKEINDDFEKKCGKKEVLTVICVLKGAVPFGSDLAKYLKMPVDMEYIRASSYKNKSEPGKVKITGKTFSTLKGKNVLIVDEIVGTGFTSKKLRKVVKKDGAKNVKFVALINNVKKRKCDVKIDYEGFRVKKTKLWTGFGLDEKQLLRNLRDIGLLSYKK